MSKGAKIKSKHLLNKYYSIVILMVFVLIINGCTAKLRTNSQCEAKATQQEKDGCYSGQAFTAAEPDYCTQIVNQDQRNSCYQLVAQRAGKVSICDKIDEDDKRDLCRGIVLNR